jgi:glycerol transport system ATP-binding protein
MCLYHGTTLPLSSFPAGSNLVTELTVTLVLENVVKMDGQETHIYETSIELKEQGFNILLGATLAGKTTLMQLMAGIQRPTSGKIWFNGEDVTGRPVQKRNISMVYQQFINYPNMSVYENIASPLRVARLPSAEIKKRVGSIAELLKLEPMLQRRPSELSGGQQQRTALARALVKDACLVLLDEPLANLDYKLREELREELPNLLADRQTTIVYATTEPTEALLLGGHTATMREGTITQYDKTSMVYRHPADLQTAKVFSDPPINTANIVKRNDRLILGDKLDWHVPATFQNVPDGDYIIGVRPHHVLPTSVQADFVEVSGTVLVTELSGSESTAHFDLEGNIWVSLSSGIQAFKVGESQKFHINLEKAMFFSSSGELIAS